MEGGHRVSLSEYVADLAVQVGLSPCETLACSVEQLELWAKAATRLMKAKAMLTARAVNAGFAGGDAMRAFWREMTQ